MILGALAYRSLKRRRLGIKANSTARQIFEMAALVAALALVLLQNRLADRLYQDPFSNVLVPAWAVIAYAVIFFKQPMAFQPAK